MSFPVVPSLGTALSAVDEHPQSGCARLVKLQGQNLRAKSPQVQMNFQPCEIINGMHPTPNHTHLLESQVPNTSCLVRLLELSLLTCMELSLGNHKNHQPWESGGSCLMCWACVVCQQQLSARSMLGTYDLLHNPQPATKSYFFKIPSAALSLISFEGPAS